MLVLYKTVVLSQDTGDKKGGLDEAPYAETLLDTGDDFAPPTSEQRLCVIDEGGQSHCGRIWSITDRGHTALNPMYLTVPAPVGRVIELCIDPMPAEAAVSASVH